jgi:hypothetical protein
LHFGVAASGAELAVGFVTEISHERALLLIVLCFPARALPMEEAAARPNCSTVWHRWDFAADRRPGFALAGNLVNR